MVKIEQLARAVLDYNAMSARALVQEFFAPELSLSRIPRPSTEDKELLVTSAALIELLSLRRKQKPPAWAAEIGPLPEPRYLLLATRSMRRLRHLCETEAPEPLRKRGLFAPPDFLEFV